MDQHRLQGFPADVLSDGLLLIFHHEIDELTRAPKIAESVESMTNLDVVADHAQAQHPGWHILFLSSDDEKPILHAAVGPRPASGGRRQAPPP